MVKNKLNKCQYELNNTIFETMMTKIENMELNGYFNPSDILSKHGFTKLSDEGKVYNSSYLEEILDKVQSRLYFKGYKCRFTSCGLGKRVEYVVKVFDVKMYYTFVSMMIAFVSFGVYMSPFINWESVWNGNWQDSNTSGTGDGSSYSEKVLMWNDMM
jgi:hypothetical protein